jgi:hypothetical protein
VEQAALAELACLAADLDARAAAVDEVQLVLLVVVVQKSPRSRAGRRRR